jgi:hypothetical protein
MTDDGAGDPAPFTETGTGNRVTHDVIEPQNVYLEDREETLVTWQGPAMDPQVARYDHAAGEWSGRHTVGTNPMDDDTHGAPAIAVGPTGRYHVTFGVHGMDIQHARTDAPHDITSWTQATMTSGEAATYTHTHAAAGDLCVVYRDGPTNRDGRLRFVRSTDAGESWSDPATFVDGGEASPRPYSSRPDPETGRIHLTWGLNEQDGVFDVYHATLDPRDGHVYSASGDDLGTLVGREKARERCLVRATETVRHTRSRVRFDGEGTPHVIFQGPGDDGLAWRYTRSNGSGWTDPATIVDGVDGFESMDFHAFPDGRLEAYLSVGRTDLQRWRHDGSTWRRVETVLQNEGAYRTAKGWNPRVVNGRPGAFVFSESHPEADGLRVWACEAGSFW